MMPLTTLSHPTKSNVYPPSACLLTSSAEYRRDRLKTSYYEMVIGPREPSKELKDTIQAHDRRRRREPARELRTGIADQSDFPKKWWMAEPSRPVHDNPH
jgi:hypothetical protein